MSQFGALSGFHPVSAPQNLMPIGLLGLPGMVTANPGIDPNGKNGSKSGSAPQVIPRNNALPLRLTVCVWRCGTANFCLNETGRSLPDFSGGIHHPGDPLTTLNKLFLVHLTGRALHTPWRNSLFVMKGTGDRNQEITHLPSGRIVIGLRESPLASGESNGVSQIRCQ